MARHLGHQVGFSYSDSQLRIQIYKEEFSQEGCTGGVFDQGLRLVALCPEGHAIKLAQNVQAMRYKGRQGIVSGSRRPKRWPQGAARPRDIVGTIGEICKSL